MYVCLLACFSLSAFFSFRSIANWIRDIEMWMCFEAVFLPVKLISLANGTYEEINRFRIWIQLLNDRYPNPSNNNYHQQQCTHTIFRIERVYYTFYRGNENIYRRRHVHQLQIMTNRPHSAHALSHTIHFNSQPLALSLRLSLALHITISGLIINMFYA